MYLRLCSEGLTFEKALFQSIDDNELIIQNGRWHENLFMKARRCETDDGILIDYVTFVPNVDDAPIIIQKSMTNINVLDAVLHNWKVFRLIDK